MSDATTYAPGWPGLSAKWTSSAKSGVGTSIGKNGRLWFTLSHGIVDEVYYPRVDQACIRDLGLLVTDGTTYFSEEKRDAHTAIESIASGVPAFRLINTVEGKYRIEKEIVSDPRREVLLQRIRFSPAQAGLHLYALLAPHLGNQGDGNTGWIGDFKGTPMLFAERDGVALALASSRPWGTRSAGFVGFSDGWQDLSRHKRLTWQFDRAENGNVALTGEIQLDDSPFVLALGFGRTSGEAAHRALASLWDGFDRALTRSITEWQQWQRTLKPMDAPLYRMSTSVLRTHESDRFPGGLIASLSIPWGFIQGDGDLGGYHLAWPRDLVESAGGLLAAGANEEAHRVLRYLAVTQEADGHWPQNMWLDGTAYWNGVQLDETGFPILLVDLARRERLLLGDDEIARLWPMVRKAASFIVRNGPCTQQDRWEEDPGYSPFTLAVEVAALLCAAELADLHEPAIAPYVRETADLWNASIERWTYVTGTDLARQHGVDGYYVRITPPEDSDGTLPSKGTIAIKNRPTAETNELAAEIVSPDALALVRFGLRAADDPRIVNTVRVIDAMLKIDVPAGPVWRRYNDDGYGEHEDGSAFDGLGVGRGWPLLTGERAHYELAAGRVEEARKLLDSFSKFAGTGGLLPEQVWDAADIPEKELFFGKATGSAMPLVWAHAEYVKLCRSLADGRVFDMPAAPVQRYQRERVGTPHALWRFNHKCETIPIGKTLRIETLAPAVVHWSADDWNTTRDRLTRDTGLGVHVVDLPTNQLPIGTTVVFTFRWPEVDRWEGTDFQVRIAPETA